MDELHEQRYRELQDYVGWTDDDARRIVALAPLLTPSLPGLIDDFYEEIKRHQGAMKVITGGQAQIERLKESLRQWVNELLSGQYDSAYVARRWRVGWRHVEIGLNQVYTNVAISRLRTGLVRALQENWQGDDAERWVAVRSLNRLLDLDLAIIEDAYQAEHMARNQRIERLATLGQVAGGVAHELRNPLNVVRTSVYYLLNARKASPEKQAEHLQRIERNVELADGVITALSSFARMPVPSLRPVQIPQCVEQALESNPLGDHVPVVLECPEGLPPVLADPDQLMIALSNLLRNARDAMPEGGTIKVGCRYDDDHVDVDITDTGVGIAREDLVRIMEPLYSTKARGLGLGLAIVRSILEKNQATLSVQSQLGEGSTFTVRLVTAPTAGNGAKSA